MITLDDLADRIARGQPLPLLPPDAAIGHLEVIRLDERGLQALRQGRDLRTGIAPDTPPLPAGALLRAYGPHGAFVGLAVSLGDGRFRAKRLLVVPEASE